MAAQPAGNRQQPRYVSSRHVSWLLLGWGGVIMCLRPGSKWAGNATGCTFAAEAPAHKVQVLVWVLPVQEVAQVAVQLRAVRLWQRPTTAAAAAFACPKRLLLLVLFLLVLLLPWRHVTSTATECLGLAKLPRCGRCRRQAVTRQPAHTPLHPGCGFWTWLLLLLAACDL